jgi:hypothetical protein
MDARGRESSDDMDMGQVLDLRRREDVDLRPRFAVLRVLLRGTLPPARRASESPIAIACLRLVTFLPDRPDRSVPRLRSLIAFRTLDEAFFPHRAISVVVH